MGKAHRPCNDNVGFVGPHVIPHKSGNLGKLARTPHQDVSNSKHAARRPKLWKQVRGIPRQENDGLLMLPYREPIEHKAGRALGTRRR
jgi:hypothetical protein